MKTRIALIVAGIAHLMWLAELFLPTGLSMRHAFVSELSARDQPYDVFFRAADAVAGLATIAGVLPFLLRRPRRWPLVAWTALAANGLFVAANSMLPLDCAPIDAPCRYRETHGLVSTVHQAHLVVGQLSFATILVAVGAFAVALRTEPFGRWSAGVFLVCLACTVAISALYLTVNRWLGPPQRLEVTVFAGWLIVLGSGLGRRVVDLEELRAGSAAGQRENAGQ